MLGFLKRFESYVHDALVFPSLRFLGCTLDAPYQGRAFDSETRFYPGNCLSPCVQLSRLTGRQPGAKGRKAPRQAGPGEPAGSGQSAGVRRWGPRGLNSSSQRL